MRIVLWVGVQLLVAGLIVVAGSPAGGGPVNSAAGWWMVYGSIIDLATIGGLIVLLRRRGISYRSVLGPPAAGWQVALGAIGVLAVSSPAVFFSSELTTAMYGGDAIPPMLALAVMLQDVVDSRQRDEATNGGVRTTSIVEVDVAG